MRLSRSESQSALWKLIEGHLEERLLSLREKNDNPADGETTAHTRGRIAEVKDLMALAMPAPELEPDILD
ncbi:MAG TPA: hypothetical protein VMX15_03080 [Candidatus Heimdallarchaeota archaeon]|nr:hypothetical protein [Candidatus Heimdallarchaeota archaeon]